MAFPVILNPMLTTPHTLVALVIAQKTPFPINLILAFLSHFVLDFCTPHWNPHLYTEFKKDKKVSKKSLQVIFIDAFIAVVFTVYFMIKALPDLFNGFVIGMSAFMAVLPDAIEIPYYFLNSKNKLLKKYVLLEHHHQAKAGIFWGNVSQVAIILASLKVLFL